MDEEELSTVLDGYDLVVPSNFYNRNECTVLVEIDPNDAINASSGSRVDFTGASGAIGRMEVDSNNQQILLDLMGHQYVGKLYPGSTAMIVTVVNSSIQNPTFEKTSSNNSSDDVVNKRIDSSSTGGQQTESKYLKVDGIANEFCKVRRVGSVMSRFNATVQGDITAADLLYRSYQDNETHQDSNNVHDNPATPMNGKSNILPASASDKNKKRKRKADIDDDDESSKEVNESSESENNDDDDYNQSSNTQKKSTITRSKRRSKKVTSNQTKQTINTKTPETSSVATPSMTSSNRNKKTNVSNKNIKLKNKSSSNSSSGSSDTATKRKDRKKIQPKVVLSKHPISKLK